MHGTVNIDIDRGWEQGEARGCYLITPRRFRMLCQRTWVPPPVTWAQKCMTSLAFSCGKGPYAPPLKGKGLTWKVAANDDGRCNVLQSDALRHLSHRLVRVPSALHVGLDRLGEEES